MGRKITADHITDVRKALGETQSEFSQRFSASRFTIIRWEQKGVKFKVYSKRWNAWRKAAIAARSLTEKESTQKSLKAG